MFTNANAYVHASGTDNVPEKMHDCETIEITKDLFYKNYSLLTFVLQ